MNVIRLFKSAFSKIGLNASDAHGEESPITSTQYWSGYHVEIPEGGFSNAESSLAHFEWRNFTHPGYIELMPVGDADGLVVMDYGCGPGNDVIGFGNYSKATELHAVDVSPLAIYICKRRAELHGLDVRFHLIKESPPEITLADKSVDLIHSSGVLHHTPDPLSILQEFRRVIKNDGRAQIMVYHYDSIWMHLYVAYQKMIVEGKFKGMAKRQAFEKTMDGEGCPIARCYTQEEFIALCREAGFECTCTGSSLSTLEMNLLPKRFDAIRDRRLDSESRQFLYSLTFNEKLWPLHNGSVSGVNACFRLTPA